MINKDNINAEKNDLKEKIIVARNNEVFGNLSKYIGVEVAIGTLDDFFADELESLALNEDILWQRHPTGGVNADGSLEYVLTSQFLDNTFRKYNNLDTDELFNKKSIIQEFYDKVYELEKLKVSIKNDDTCLDNIKINNRKISKTCVKNIKLFLLKSMGCTEVI